MSNSNGVITAPISITTDISPVLGVSNYDLGYLCANTHGKINMWAKYKPVWHNDLFIDIRNAYIAKYSGNESRLSGFHSDGDCGVAPMNREQDSFGNNTSRGELIKKASIGQWHYASPQGDKYTDAYGNVACPYRATDFELYNIHAFPPIYVSPSYQNKTIELTEQQFVSYMIELESPEEYSLQVVDIANAGLVNLKRCKLIGALYRNTGVLSSIVEADDFLIDEAGEALIQSIRFNLKEFPYSNGHKVYLALRYIPEDGGNIYFYPIPTLSSQTATFPLTLNCTINITANGGIENWETDVYISPYETTTFSQFKLFYDTCEEGTGKYSMTNNDGNMSLRIKLTNNSSFSKTLYRTNFQLSTAKVTKFQSTKMTNDAGNTISYITIPAKSYAWIYLLYSDVLKYSTSITGKYESQEIFFYIKDIENFSGSLYYHCGSSGWNNL